VSPEEAVTYPMVITRAGGRARPRAAQLLANGIWRVKWITGSETLYDRDPRGHLLLGYEPPRW
jgi:hypothetical protein